MERVEAADFHELDAVTTPRLSPDGEQVAFVKRSPEDDEEYEATIYIVDTDGGEPRRFTLEAGVDASPRWSPGGERLAFTSTRGEDDDRQQLWVLPTDGGEAAQMTAVVGGVSQPRWAPDGERIAFVQQVSKADREEGRDTELPEEFEPEPPDPRVIDRTVYRTGERYLDGKRNQIYLLELESEDIERVTDGERDAVSPAWGDSETLYYATDADVPDPDDSLETEIRAYDLDTGESSIVHETTTFQPALAATSDGHVAVPYTDPQAGTMAQTEIHLLDADHETVYSLTAGLDRSLAAGLGPEWDETEQQLYFGTPDEGATALWRVGIPDGSTEKTGPVPVETEPERVLREEWAAISSAHPRAGRVAYVQSNWDHPGDLFVTALEGEEQPRRLTECNAAYLSAHAVQKPEEIRYPVGEAGSAASEMECQGWLLTPPDFDPDEEYPLVVEIHGGPHAMWTTSGTMWHEFQTLAARGYVVFWSNPRGSVGYGESYMQAIERDWGAVTASDVLAGVEEVTARPYVDETQQFLTGGSFGGFITAWLVGQTDQFEAAVAQRGVYDLIGFYGSTDWAYKLVEDEFRTTPWEEPAVLQEHSPTGHAHEVETPTLLVHSEDDYRTPVCTAELFHRILRKHGVDTRLVRYPAEGHELSRSGQPAHIVDRIERIARWFDGYAATHDVSPALERDPEAGLTGTDGEEENKNSEVTTEE